MRIHPTIYQKDLSGDIIATKDIIFPKLESGSIKYKIHPDFASCGMSVHKVEAMDCRKQDMFSKSKSGYDGIGCVIPMKHIILECKDAGNDCEFAQYDRP